MLNPDTHTAGEVARSLGLEPLDQEGGYFRRTLEAGLPAAEGPRAWSVIYSLITPAGFSAMHRLAADELWFFQAGDPLESLRLSANGSGAWVKLAAPEIEGTRAQSLVPAGTWQGTRLAAGGRWALCSCVVVPEFRWSEFELGERAALIENYPAWADAIRSLTRESPRDA